MKLITENSEKILISDGLNWHITNSIPLHDNVYRFGSTKYFKLINESRRLYHEGKLFVDNLIDEFILNTDIGKIGYYENKRVPLDIPIIESEYKGRDVELRKPSRSSGPTKYKVYVKNDKGNVIKINFGDKKGGLSAKIKDPDARRDFANRHDCKNKKDKTTAGYWSCNLPKYASYLGLGKNMNTFW